jgi:dTDP-glucose 4,6-dehydratase
MLEMAGLIAEIAGSDSEVVFAPRPVDDPEMRCPDITLARSALGWEPTTSLADGLKKTIDWARDAWSPDSSHSVQDGS